MPEFVFKAGSTLRIRNRVFISYCRENTSWAKRIKKHLRTLELSEVLEVWDDTKISAGEKWEEQIQIALQSSGVAILVVSTDYLNSSYILEKELPVLLKAAKDKEARVIPVIVEAVMFEGGKELSSLQAVNQPGRPLHKLPKHAQDQALLELAREVKAYCVSPHSVY